MKPTTTMTIYEARELIHLFRREWEYGAFPKTIAAIDTVLAAEERLRECVVPDLLDAARLAESALAAIYASRQAPADDEQRAAMGELNRRLTNIRAAIAKAERR